VHELIWPVTTSTLTTVVVFLPLRLLKGVVGQFFAALSITLTIAVLVSLLLALTIIPLMSDQFLTREDAEAENDSEAIPVTPTPGFGTFLIRVRRALDTLSVRYQRSLERVLHEPRRVVRARLEGEISMPTKIFSIAACMLSTMLFLSLPNRAAAVIDELLVYPGSNCVRAAGGTPTFNSNGWLVNTTASTTVVPVSNV